MALWRSYIDALSRRKPQPRHLVCIAVTPGAGANLGCENSDRSQRPGDGTGREAYSRTPRSASLSSTLLSLKLNR